MANITAADVKRLRDATAAGMLDCKKALEAAGGDFDAAVEILRVKGAKDVGKRAGRTAANHQHVRIAAAVVAGGMAQVRPRRAAEGTRIAVAARPPAAGVLFVALQLIQRGKKRPGFSVP